uniref:Uncharacterized protein n=1 Tax=Sinocyclocheilus grahami TaxID=75366 RepID=A0A672KQW7_SINGR
MLCVLLLFFPSGALFRLIHQQSAVLVFSAMSTTYDPQYCYILDAFLLLYCIIITAFFMREVYPSQETFCIFKKLNSSTYDILTQRSTEEGRSGGVSQTYLISQLNIRSLSNKSHFIWFNVFVFQGLSSMTKDTYDSLNKQPIRPPPR